MANSLLFYRHPPRLIAEIVFNIIFWFSSFPLIDRVHVTISPRTLLTGLALDYNKDCEVAFSTYIQVHKEGDNSLSPIIETSFGFATGMKMVPSYSTHSIVNDF